MRKKVLFLIRNLQGGGAEKVLCDIVKNMDKDKFDITVMTIYDSGLYIDEIKKNIKYKTFFKELKPGKNILKKICNVLCLRLRELTLKIAPKIIYYLKIKEKFDVEIAFLEGMSTKIIANSNNKLSKKIAWVHTDLKNNNWALKFYKNLEEQNHYYNRFNKIVFVSNDSKEKFEEVFINNNITKDVIYNPIISSEIIKKSKLENIVFNDFTIISVGRLVSQKGYDRLIKVHSQLVKLYPHKLLILGEGADRQYLERLIKDLDVEKSVELKGFIKNPYPYIKAADLYVCSSRAEGYPLVVAESIILNKAILSTDVTGPMELLDSGRYGLICNNTEQDLRETIEAILKNKSMISIYEDKSKIRSKDFDYKSIINQIENLIS